LTPYDCCDTLVAVKNFYRDQLAPIARLADVGIAGR
jgi:hypothetical protein